MRLRLSVGSSSSSAPPASQRGYQMQHAATAHTSAGTSRLQQTPPRQQLHCPLTGVSLCLSGSRCAPAKKCATSCCSSCCSLSDRSSYITRPRPLRWQAMHARKPCISTTSSSAQQRSPQFGACTRRSSVLAMRWPTAPQHVAHGQLLAQLVQLALRLAQGQQRVGALVDDRVRLQAAHARRKPGAATSSCGQCQP